MVTLAGRALAKKKTSKKSDRLQDVTPQEMEDECQRIEDLISEIRSLAKRVREAGLDKINMDGSRHADHAANFLQKYAGNISRYLIKAQYEN